MKMKKEEEMESSNNREKLYLVWEDLSVMLGDKSKRKLLNRVNGYALSHRIMAIMGPSGSGKSTLLDALSGRLSPNIIMSGNVLLNGKHRSIGCKNISYVAQEDFFLGTLTVRETLTYSANLRLPTTMSRKEIKQVVENTITKMGLEECGNNKIGNWYMRGISGGEKKRLSISLEILTQPQVMFLDEPTSGLDSASAFFVVQVLKNIALEGKLVVCSIHQPSSYIFDLFDDLCLLSSGEAIYFGEAKTAIKFFGEAGFPCPIRSNPSDHFLKCINSDFDKIASIRLRSQNDLESSPSSSSQINMSTQAIKEMLIEKYKISEYSLNTRKRIREITLINEELPSNDLKIERSSWWKRLWILTHRSLVNMNRDLVYYWIRILFCVLVSLGTGIMFFDIGLSAPAILARIKCYTFFFDFLLCLCVGGLPSISEEWKVLYYERFNGHYGEGEFVVANSLSSFPFLVIIAISSGTIAYSMVKFHMGISIYWHLCINLFCCMSIMECVTMTVALLVPNFLMGIGASAAVIMLLTIASGLYRPLSELPNFFWRYPMTYISFTTWAVQGQYKNDLIGLEFKPLMPGGRKIKGEEVLEKAIGSNMNYNKWWDIAALLLILFCHRLIFFIVLKYRETTRLKLGKFRIKQTAKPDAASISFGREKHGSFGRKPPLHPLSSQEGLSSPLPN